MKFAIVSDTHDNIPNFLKIIDFLNNQGIDTILHCGDICHEAIMNEAREHFKGNVYYVRGNGDYYLDQLPEKMEMALDRKNIAFTHFPDLARQLAKSGKYDLVFHGHTHRPWEEKIGSCRLVNPGEVAGQRFKPTFAIYDTENDKLELKILEKI